MNDIPSWDDSEPVGGTATAEVPRWEDSTPLDTPHWDDSTPVGEPPSPTPQTDSALAVLKDIYEHGGERLRRMHEPLVKEHPWLAGAVKLIAGQVPVSQEELKGAVKPPMETNVAEQQQRSEQWRQAVTGELGPVEQAVAVGSTVLQTLPLAGLPFAKSPLRLGVPEVRPPPTAIEAQIGPTDYGGYATPEDLAAARAGVYPERQFTMVQPPPEAAPELAAAPTVEETLAATAPRTTAEGYTGFPGAEAAPEVPITAETARIGGEQPYAIEPSYAQMEGGAAPLGVQEGALGAVPEAGRSDYALGETQGAQPGGEVPQPGPAGEAVAAEAPTANEPVSPGLEQATPQTTALANAVTAVERETRGLSPREEVERRNWDQAKAIADREAASDPARGARLVDELNQKPRALDDIEGAHLLRRKAEVNAEHDAAIRQMNASPEDVNAMARLKFAREELQKTYNATEVSGTAWGRGGKIRQALMAEDFSIQAMEAKARAIGNKGKPLGEPQLRQVAEHYGKISKQEASIRLTENALQSPTGRMQPTEILAEVEKMKQRLAPCL